MEDDQPWLHFCEQIQLRAFMTEAVEQFRSLFSESSSRPSSSSRICK